MNIGDKGLIIPIQRGDKNIILGNAVKIKFRHFEFGAQNDVTKVKAQKIILTGQLILWLKVNQSNI